ncbi:MAG: aminoglycoside 6-adenylyltransferase [Cyclobacteriaceae bacterium]|nr:aminoglycoside 6-adenylyltransferase [Cyclobacteriaceae bacterium]
MRSEDEMMELILKIAKADERIRAALLSGSRANPETAKDIFQDFDIIYVVTELDSFMKDHSWIDVFGERIIMQLPEEMIIGEKAIHSFSYLMLFKDRNRIDLTLFPIDKLETEFRQDSLTIRLIDKDKRFENLASPTNTDHLIQEPTEKLFIDCCNEFWWVSTYVGKGLWRNDIPYAKDMLEGTVRSMFMKIIEWNIGIQTNFNASFGQSGRNMKKYISNELYDKILSTYPDSNIRNIWHSLFLMNDLFDELAKGIANKMRFTYNESEANNVKEHLKWVQSTNKN